MNNLIVAGSKRRGQVNLAERFYSQLIGSLPQSETCPYGRSNVETGLDVRGTSRLTCPPLTPEIILSGGM